MGKINLNCLLLNAENLFLLSDQELKAEHLKLDPIRWRSLSTSIYENKPLDKLNQLTLVIKKSNPDVIMLCEVGGIESLTNFNRLFLNNAYSPVLIEGNSDRNIDVGYLIKKDLGFYFDLISNKNRLINFVYPHGKSQQSEKFSRDVSELHLFTTDREKPFFIFLLTHLKSRLDPQSVDPNGFLRRKAEMKTLLEIYSDLENKFQNQVPMAVCGDFNGLAAKPACDPEFAEIYTQTGLEDVLELAQIPNVKRATYYQTSRNGSTEGKQIDYAFLSPKAHGLLLKDSASVYRYRDELDQELDPPTSIEAKESLPSDHYPVLFTLSQIPLR